MNFRKAVCAVLSIFMLTGCKSTTIVENKPKDELEGSITIWASKENSSLISLSAYNFNKLHSTSSIKIVEAGSNELFDKLQVSLISKDNLPDMVCINDEDVQRYIKANTNTFEDMSSELKKENYLKYKTDNLTVEGKTYGFPASSNPIVLLYRSDIYQAAGINTEYIKTWDDYIEAGKTIVSKDNKAAFTMPLEDERLYRIFLNQLSGSYFDKDGKPEVNTPKAIRVLELFKKMYSSGMAKETRNFEEALELFKKGEVSGVLVSTDQVKQIYKDAPELKDKLKTMKLPAFEEGGNQAAAISGNNLLLLKSAKNKKLTLEFARFTAENRDNLGSLINETGVTPAYTYYNDEKGFGDKRLLDLSKDIYAINYTENFIKIKDSISKAAAVIVKEGKETSSVMEDMQKSLSIPSK